MTRAPAPKVRCAIYTRKSSEEGLEQGFNSLHAQREACEAYVQSQIGEGWSVIPKAYDDGGFSGGSMDRPGLRRLLADIEAGRIDVLIVYKVDRLTRSLTDFARIIEQFDARQVSFVSVTQAFNTTSSMGRLTLNVLLSFAQFEREVTGERIRDKIAASKAKGMWMGGNLALGYDRPAEPGSRALAVNEGEAETVRYIFTRYLELGSVHDLVRDLDARGIRSKSYVSKNGRAIGGLPFGRGALFHLLKNRLYLGEIPHKGKTYPGLHAAIVDQELFDAVQARLGAAAGVHRERPTRVSTAPLKGLLFDADGAPMSPTFSHGRGGRIYRYYVSTTLQQGQRPSRDDDAIRRAPCEAIDELVLDRVRRIAKLQPGAGWPMLASLLRRVEIHPTSVHIGLNRPALMPAYSDPAVELPRLQKRLAPGDRAVIDVSDDALLRIILPVRVKVVGGRTWITTPQGRPAVSKPVRDPTLIKALRSSHDLLTRLNVHPRMSADQLHQSRGALDPYRHSLCALALLAPDIQSAILEGRQPPGLKLEQLIYITLPVAWEEQRTLLGFSASP